MNKKYRLKWRAKRKENNMNKKYELTDETKEIWGITLHRIRALMDISRYGVRAGDIGGWIEAESNLSQYGNAWVSDDARVYGNAKVCGNAWVSDDARVCGNAWVSDDAKVYGDARVYGDAKVCDDAKVCGDARVYGNAKVCGNAVVCGDARVYGEALVNGNAEVSGDAEVKSIRDYAVFKNGWSSGRWFTYTRSNRMWRVGCFHGTGEELIAKAYKDSELSGKCYEAIVRAQEAIDKAIEEAKEAK